MRTCGPRSPPRRRSGSHQPDQCRWLRAGRALQHSRPRCSRSRVPSSRRGRHKSRSRACCCMRPRLHRARWPHQRPPRGREVLPRIHPHLQRERAVEVMRSTRGQYPQARCLPSSQVAPVQPGAQSQAKASRRSRHVAPCRQGALAQSSRSASHKVPPQPRSQAQLKPVPPPSSAQTPCAQG